MKNIALTPKEIPAEIYNFKKWVTDINPTNLSETINKLLNQCQFTVLSFVDYNFPNNGYTALWLLAESHLAIHTFAEKNLTYIELSGCNYEKNLHFQNKINQIYTDAKKI